MKNLFFNENLFFLMGIRRGAKKKKKIISGHPVVYKGTPFLGTFGAKKVVVYKSTFLPPGPGPRHSIFMCTFWKTSSRKHVIFQFFGACGA